MAFNIACASDPTFRDARNFTCIAYDSYKWCQGGGYGVNWDPVWGVFDAFKNKDGIDASQACCSCKTGCSSCKVEVCHNDDSWFDSNGYSCRGYETEKFCHDGVIGSNWVGGHSFEVFASYDGFDATQKCCECSAKKDVSCITEGSSQFGISLSTGDECCISNSTWTDSIGRSCLVYANDMLCENGEEGRGWLTTLDFSDFADENGVDASKVCCGCMSQELFKGEQMNACIDDDAWVDSNGLGCPAYAYKGYCDGRGNFGQYWIAGDTFSKFAAHGYDASEKCCDCSRKKTTMCTKENSYLAELQVGSVYDAADIGSTCCFNNDTWRDSRGQGCDHYVAQSYCDRGRYGSGWELLIPATFASFADADGFDATDKCCQCFRSPTDAPLPGQACFNDDGWQDSKGRDCFTYMSMNYCDGEGYDPAWISRGMGDFSDYASSDGYDATHKCCGCSTQKNTTCAPVRQALSTAIKSGVAGLIVASSECCVNDDKWRDTLGRSCVDYERLDFCAVGHYGSGWSSSAGRMAALADADGLSAPDACCACRTTDVCPTQTFSWTPGERCQACPVGASCVFGDRHIGFISITNGFGYSSVRIAGYWHPDPNNSPLVLPCLNVLACVGADLSLVSDILLREDMKAWLNLELAYPPTIQACAAGYQGNLCNRCSPGYHRSGVADCVACASETRRRLGFALVAIVVVVCMISYLWLLLRRQAGVFRRRQSQRELGEDGAATVRPHSIDESVIIKIMFNHMQVLALAKGFNMDWPPVLNTLFEYFDSLSSPASGMASGLECDAALMAPYISFFYFKTICLSAIPVLGILFFAVYWLKVHNRLQKCFNKEELPMEHLRARLTLSSLVLVFFMQSSLSKQAFLIFTRKQLGPLGYFFQEDLDVPCYGSARVVWLLTLGLGTLVFYAGGIPFSVWLMLYQRRKRLENPHVRFQFAFIFQEYQKRFYYWETLIILRKVGLTAVVVFLSAIGIYLQTVFALMFLTGALLLHILYSPYIEPSLNRMEFYGIVVGVVTLFLGLFLTSSPSTSSIGTLSSVISTIATVLIVAVNVFYLMFCGYILSHHLIARFKKVYVVAGRHFQSRRRVDVQPRHHRAHSIAIAATPTNRMRPTKFEKFDDELPSHGMASHMPMAAILADVKVAPVSWKLSVHKQLSPSYSAPALPIDAESPRSPDTLESLAASMLQYLPLEKQVEYSIALKRAIKDDRESLKVKES